MIVTNDLELIREWTMKLDRIRIAFLGTIRYL